MAPLSSGDKFRVRQPGGEWAPLAEAYLREATEYEWTWETEEMPERLAMGGVPLAYRSGKNGVEGRFITPFQSGHVEFALNRESYPNYVYPDERKLTTAQFELMMTDILEEADVCFQYAGLTLPMESEGKDRRISWAQWNYVDYGFQELAGIVRRILERPLRRLRNEEVLMRREQVKSVSVATTRWLERHYGDDEGGAAIPPHVVTSIRREHYGIYENALLKRFLSELQGLLLQYMVCGLPEVQEKARTYMDRVQYWLRQELFQGIAAHRGPIQVSTILRKHPVYRLGYLWFERLYRHGKARWGFGVPFPLKDTFALYEIWCYMQLVRLFRRKGLLQETQALYRTAGERLFLSLAKHRESRVSLVEGYALYYQRVFRWNSPTLYSFTQQMEPDITIEDGKRVLVFDPKYRVPANVGTALGEMHKYRDGIVSRENDSPAVEAVFILTPSRGGPEDELRYFQEWYHERYRMGAIELAPGKGESEALERAVDRFFRSGL
ncbi:DUF2357 domain-containing protein [Paenibacillus antri]|uniref:DUF2357 domain-containing protein n=1 Tax=Paenibacillus antri TaxID=2582848 RepID=A0A5R9GLT3_9BACL|nr:DUF2357 domain-containing protein [Paenibacillus antri]TLS54113.1 DUF2357 domain-containing protein [Paenibacillus antri]